MAQIRLFDAIFTKTVAAGSQLLFILRNIATGCASTVVVVNAVTSGL